MEAMAVLLTPDQEQRIQAIVHSGAYESARDVVEAAITALEQRAEPYFQGDADELEALLLQGVASSELSDDEFWNSVNRVTDAMLDAHDDHKQR
jgi:Arc/MetJ-type ribon-helix-helix transcriptional regulator